MKYELDWKAFVSADGSYGVDNILTFDYDEFFANYPHAWDALDSVSDSSRIELIVATLDEDEELIYQLCAESDLNPKHFLA